MAHWINQSCMVNRLRWSWRYWITFAIALLSINFSGCVQFSMQVTQPHELHSSQLSKFIPDQSLFVALVSPFSVSRDWYHSNLLAPLSLTATSVLSAFSIDFNQDVRPWLGDDIAFAVIDKDFDRNRRNGRQAGYLLVVDASDGNILREFLQLFWQRQSLLGAQPVLAEVSGVPIVAGWVDHGSRKLATAVVGGSTLLVANDVKVLLESLRVAQVPDLQLQKHKYDATTWISLHVPEFFDWLGIATPQKLSLMSVAQLQQLTAAIDLYPERLEISTALTGLDTDLVLSESVEAFSTFHADGPSQYLPDSVAWAAVGCDLQPLWTSIKSELSNYQKLPSSLQQGQQWLSTQLAQALLQPLAQLLANDYAVGQLDNGDGLMAVRASNSMMVDQLDDIAKQQGLTISRLMLEGQPVILWSRLKTRVDFSNRETTVETDVVGAHTKIDDYHIFATSLSSLAIALEAPVHKLAASKRFQRTLQLLDISNQGYIYGTWSDLERLLASNRWFSLVKPIVQPWSQAIDAIAITSYGQTADQLTGAISILLKS
ncbi:MAG: DUF3352 domain-containing protein [Leptolyngbya sp. SIO3F4]|nr:DUF3352 domain-containing protein [Leptolyngbya sp. SIO3F4]